MRICSVRAEREYTVIVRIESLLEGFKCHRHAILSFNGTEFETRLRSYVPLTTKTEPLQASNQPALTTLPLAALLAGTDSPVTWLVPDLLPQGSLVVLAGESGAGKSVLCYTLSLALASGTDFLGQTLSPPQSVVYFDQENSRPDCIQYLRWAWHGLGCPALPPLAERLHVASFQLGSRTWVERAASLVMPTQPALIIIDTATIACDIQDENSNGEATQALLNIRRLQALVTPPATALVLKHSKVTTEHHQRTIRGAKAWLGTADAVIFHLRNPGQPRKDGLQVTRLEPWKTRAFGLKSTLYINPRWTADTQGLILTGHSAEPRP